MNKSLVLILLCAPALHEAAARDSCIPLYQPLNEPTERRYALAGAWKSSLLAVKTRFFYAKAGFRRRGEDFLFRVATPAGPFSSSHRQAPQEVPGYDGHLDEPLAAGRVLHEAGRFAAAESVLRRFLATLPDAAAPDSLRARLEAQARHLLAEGVLGRCRTRQGRCSLEEALADADEAALLFERAGLLVRAGQTQLTQADILAWMGRPGEPGVTPL